MQNLLGHRLCTSEDINSFKNTVSPVEDLYVKWEAIFNTYPSFIFEQYFDRFTGGLDGRLIVYYKHKIGTASKEIQLFDHEFNEIDKIRLPFDITNAFVYLTNNDYLVVLVQKENKLSVDIYFHGRLFSSLPIPCESEIAGSYFWESGCVFITKENQVWYLPHFKDPKLYATINTKESVSRIAAIPPQDSQSGELIFYALGYSTNIYVGNGSTVRKIDLPEVVQYFALSPTNEHIAFLFNNNYLLITPADFSECICHYDVLIDKPVLSFQWLSSMIIIGYENEVALFTSMNTLNTWSVEGKPLIFADSKHALIFSNSRLYELAVVSNQLADALSISSENPTSTLLNASINSNVHLIDLLKDKNQLEEAINSIVVAASDITTSERLQRSFMLAAALGNGLIGETSDLATNTIKCLRIANDIRKNLKIFISPKSVEKLMYSSTLPLKYCDAKNHAMAFEIASYLGVDESPIVTDWACTIIESFPDDEEAISILKSRYCMSFDATQIAIMASHMGRHNVAVGIAELEKYPLKLIDFFKQTGNWEGAIISSYRAADSSKYLKTVKDAIEAEAIEPLKKVLVENPGAFQLLVLIAGSDKSINDIINTVTSCDHTAEMSIRKIIQALGNSSKPDNFKGANAAIDKIKTVLPKYALAESSSKMIERYEENLLAQEKNADKLKDFTGKSLNQTIKHIIDSGDIDAALKFASNAKVKDPRAQLIVARTVILGKKKELYTKVAQVCKHSRQIAASMILLSEGNEAAMKFVEDIPDEKDRMSIKEALQEGLLNKSELGSKNISSNIILKKSLFSEH